MTHEMTKLPNGIPKSDTSNTKLVFKGIGIKRLNVVMMTSKGRIAMLARLLFSLWTTVYRAYTVHRQQFIEHTQFIDSSL